MSLYQQLLLRRTAFIVLILIAWSESSLSFKISSRERREPQLGKEFMMVSAICQKKSKASSEMVDHFHESAQLFKEENFKCFMACILRVGKMMSKNKIKVEEMEDAFLTLAPDTDPSKTDTLKAVSSCAREEPGINACETAYNFFSCLHHMGKSYGPQRAGVWEAVKDGRSLKSSSGHPFIKELEAR